MSKNYILSDLPYTEMIKNKIIQEIEKIEPDPKFTNDFNAGINFMKEQILKVIREKE